MTVDMLVHDFRIHELRICFKLPMPNWGKGVNKGTTQVVYSRWLPYTDRHRFKGLLPLIHH